MSTVKRLTAKEWAEKLNGRQYREEVTPEEERELFSQNFLLVTGASDDIMMFYGFLNDEHYDKVNFNLNEPIENNCEDNCPYFRLYLSNLKDADRVYYVEPVWGATDEYSWTYKTDFGMYAEFDIMEDDEKYARAMIIDMTIGRSSLC